MLKWILAAVAALLLILGGSCWYGYKQLTKGGDTAQVTIASSPERVWRYLTMPDSIRAWQDSTAMVATSSDSVLAVGDTVQIASARRRGPERSSQRMVWIVTRMSEPTVIAWAARDDSIGTELLRRIDSLVASGDSVTLISRFATPLTDSLGRRDSTGALAGRFLSGAGKLATAAMRAMAEQELARLKVVLERP